MFTLDRIVPWGRSFDEYTRMFALTDADLAGQILGCADGPASFNAEATRRGSHVVSCDPLYAFDASQIRARIAATSNDILEQTRQHRSEFVWGAIASPEDLLRLRMDAMDIFLSDYERGRDERRYINAALPRLPFEDNAFDLACCSHFLFLYSEQLDEALHCAATAELCRVAGEVRIFPLLTLGGAPSPHVGPVAQHVRRAGWAVSIERVPYEFQRGGNQMMRITRTTTT
ncbi:MAG TPA: hypothetical protein VJM31_09510 [Vicinamibacterales bacterium]|nr:hypothetical protein [Vicinamibacterales bacterium]